VSSVASQSQTVACPTAFAPPPLPAPKNNPINFTVGDKVRMAKYGVGKVLEIRNAGADYEVTIEFETVGRKKFMANLLKVAKET